MSPIISIIRVIVLTGVGLLVSLFLSIPVHAAGDVPVILSGDNPAAEAIVRLDSFDASSAVGDENPAAPVETPTTSAADPVTGTVVTDPELISPEIDEVMVVPAPKPVTEPQNPEQPGSFVVYLPVTVQMATLAAQ